MVVLRDGEFVGELEQTQIDRDRIVRMMVGRDVSQFYQRTPHPPGNTAIVRPPVAHCGFSTRATRFFSARRRDCRRCRLSGCGRTELLTTLFGVTPAVGGSLTIAGQELTPRNPAEAIRAGVVLAPEDRRSTGLMLTLSVERNLSLASLRNKLNVYGFIRGRGESELCRQTMDQLEIKSAHPRWPVRWLSGGNQQKVVLGKWLATQPSVLLLDEPTRGIDIGSKSEIYRLMHELAGQGVAIVFASSDMEEILGLSDRVLVMHQGRMAAKLSVNS